MTLVSTIMPAYNCEHYIGAAIHSVLAQSVQDWELIVVDDGSTDQTLHVAQTAAVLDHRIRVQHQSNSGSPAAARNAGLSLASGTFVQFLDADDLYHADKCRQQTTVLLAHPDIDVVFADIVWFHSDPLSADAVPLLKSRNFLDRARNYLHPLGGHTFACKDDFYKFMSLEMTSLHTQTLMVRRSVFDHMTEWFRTELVIGEDTDLFFRLARSYRMAYIDDVVAYYRRHPAGVSHQKEKLLLAAARVHEENLRRGSDVFTAKERRKYAARVAADYFHIAWYYRSQLDLRRARCYYRKSLHLRPRLQTVTAYLKSFLPKKFLAGRNVWQSAEAREPR